MSNKFFKGLTAFFVLISLSLPDSISAMETRSRTKGKIEKSSESKKQEEPVCSICYDAFETEKHDAAIPGLILVALNKEIPDIFRFSSVIRLLGTGTWKVAMRCCGQQDNFICSQCVTKIETGQCPLCKQFPFRGTAHINDQSIKFSLPINIQHFTLIRHFCDDDDSFFTDTELKGCLITLLQEQGIQALLTEVAEITKANVPNLLRELAAKKEQSRKRRAPAK